MPADNFLKVEGIKGESTDDAHKDWIEVLSFNTGVSQMASGSASTAGGGTVARADFQDFSIVKTLDSSSPLLALACAEGRAIKEVLFEMCRSGGDKLKYMEVKLGNCIISSISLGGGGGGEATESVTLNFGKIEWNYIKQKRADGSGGGNIPAGWNLEANKKV